MAEEESTDIPVTSEKIELEESHDSTKDSIEVISIPKEGGRRIHSRYLRASIGSCHDLCKYGLKPPFEEKPGSEDQNLKRTTSLLMRDRKHGGGVGSKPVPDNKTSKSNNLNMFIKKEKKTSAKAETQVVSETQPMSSPPQQAGCSNSKGKEQKRDSGESSRIKIKSRSDEIGNSSIVGDEKKNLKPSPSAVSKHGVKNKNLKGISISHPRKLKPNPTIDEDTPEKTLYVVEPPGGEIGTTEGSTEKGDSTTNLSQPSSSTSSLKGKGLKQNPSVGHDINKEGKIIRARRREIVTPGVNSNFSSRKLRRGKVIDIQPDQNNAPKRLKFRRVKLLTEIPTGKSEMRKKPTRNKVVIDEDKQDETKTERSVVTNKRRSSNLRIIRKEGDDGKSSTTAGTKSEEKVVLRHRDSNGKKNVRRLFNNVIEETASKLVKTRKSKVKALVGAFETVISLQDTAPSSASVVE